MPDSTRRAYSFGRRRRPPRGTMYMSTIKATMTTAATATMAVVDAARIIRPFLPCGLLAKLGGERNSPRFGKCKSEPPEHRQVGM
jgi:hypothetical protein